MADPGPQAAQASAPDAEASAPDAEQADLSTAEKNVLFLVMCFFNFKCF